MADRLVQVATYVPKDIADLIGEAARATQETRSGYLHRLILSDLKAQGWLDEALEPVVWKAPLFKVNQG